MPYHILSYEQQRKFHAAIRNGNSGEAPWYTDDPVVNWAVDNHVLKESEPYDTFLYEEECYYLMTRVKHGLSTVITSDNCNTLS